MQYVSGSHEWGEHNPRRFADQTPYEGTGLPELPDIESNRDQYDILGWDIAPGDCLVFQAMIVHGASGNVSSTTRRRAWATRWLGDDVRFCKRSGEVGFPTYDTGLKQADDIDCAHFPKIL